MQSWQLDMLRVPVTSSACWNNQQAVRLLNVILEQPHDCSNLYALVSISLDVPPAFPILARLVSAPPLCHGPGACLGALTNCGNLGKSFPQLEQEPPCKLSPPLQVVTYRDAGVGATRTMWKFCSVWKLPPRFAECGSVPVVLYIDPLTNYEVTVFTTCLTCIHCCNYRLSFAEREWLQISWKSKLAFRSKAAIPKHICMYVCAYIYLGGREKAGKKEGRAALFTFIYL